MWCGEKSWTHSEKHIQRGFCLPYSRLWMPTARSANCMDLYCAEFLNSITIGIQNRFENFLESDFWSFLMSRSSLMKSADISMDDTCVSLRSRNISTYVTRASIYSVSLLAESFSTSIDIGQSGVSMNCSKICRSCGRVDLSSYGNSAGSILWQSFSNAWKPRWVTIPPR